MARLQSLGCDDSLVAITWLEQLDGYNHLVAMTGLVATIAWLQSLGYNACLVAIAWLQ